MKTYPAKLQRSPRKWQKVRRLIFFSEIKNKKLKFYFSNDKYSKLFVRNAADILPLKRH